MPPIKTELFPSNLVINAPPTPPSSKPRDTPSSKLPSWSQSQLQEAIESVITQQLRFTQASSRYGIPKGTLYDNILGKSKRMLILEQIGLTEAQELSVLEFCCEISCMPYNRRTSRSLKDVIQFITTLKQEEGKKEFHITMREGFRWWWAFTKKHNIISLHYQEDNSSKASKVSKASSESSKSTACSPEEMLSMLSNPLGSSVHISLPWLGATSKYSLSHPDYTSPPRAHAT